MALIALQISISLSIQNKFTWRTYIQFLGCTFIQQDANNRNPFVNVCIFIRIYFFVCSDYFLRSTVPFCEKTTWESLVENKHEKSSCIIYVWRKIFLRIELASRDEWDYRDRNFIIVEFGTEWGEAQDRFACNYTLKVEFPIYLRIYLHCYHISQY